MDIFSFDIYTFDMFVHVICIHSCLKLYTCFMHDQGRKTVSAGGAVESKKIHISMFLFWGPPVGKSFSHTTSLRSMLAQGHVGIMMPLWTAMK